MNRENLILEIGTEEIPSRFMDQALKDLKDKIERELKEARIDHGAVNTYGTPRRLVLSVKDLASSQSDLVESFKGPAWNGAFDGSGTPTRAALGFAKSKSMKVEDLEKREVDGVPYAFAVVSKKGADTEAILPDLLVKVMGQLTFPKNMYWDKPSVRFARPIRWIMCLLGDRVLPLSFGGIEAGNASRGHRFMGSPSFAVEKESAYMEKLYDNYVIVDQEKRKEKMLSSIAMIEKELDGTAEKDPDLVQENLYLVEYPIPFYGSFDGKYLELPEEILITTMKHHQKYFPVRDQSGKLMAYFVGVSNNRAVSMDKVREGNERVLKARLEDASFFWKEDLKVTLAKRTEGLKKVVYQEKLGSVYDKVQAVAKISRSMCRSLGLKDLESLVEKAASIGKSDLLTYMVGEFPELQGVMGREYALQEGEDKRVALALYEQYLPKSAGDSLPTDLVGALIGLGERIYNMAGAFKIGFRPSGSQDPYGLRRAARCVNEILWGMDIDLDLDWAIGETAEILGLEKEGLEELRSFLRQRMLLQLKEKNYSHDMASLAVAVAGSRPLQALKYLKALDSVKGEKWFTDLCASALRVKNILAKAKEDQSLVPDEKAFTLPQEGNLYEAIKDKSKKAEDCMEKRDWDGLMETLSELSPSVSAFFDSVMVMDDDEVIRKNRLALLRQCDGLFQKVGDMSRLKAQSV